MSKMVFRKKIFFVFSLLQFSIFTFSQNSFAAPTSSADVFPKLPKSNVCTAEKIHGVWKLVMVYEVPSGREIELYTNRPLQYMVFEANSLYGDYVSPLRAITPDEVRSAVLAQKPPKQFTVNSKGAVFIYNAGIATDTLACFIADESSGPFESGQMLIMPPKNVAKGRMVKVYAKTPDFLLGTNKSKSVFDTDTSDAKDEKDSGDSVSVDTGTEPALGQEKEKQNPVPEAEKLMQ